MIGESGNVVLAKQLNYEVQRKYNLTISVTDGIHTVFTQVRNIPVLSTYLPYELMRVVWNVNVFAFAHLAVRECGQYK